MCADSGSIVPMGIGSGCFCCVLKICRHYQLSVGVRKIGDLHRERLQTIILESKQ